MDPFRNYWRWHALPFLGAVAAIAFLGCSADPISVGVSTNPHVRVELLAEHDGCRIYRFSDGDASTHYYVRCPEVPTAAVETTRIQSCGKNCFRYVPDVAPAVRQ